MTGELAQLIALTSYGNAFLATDKLGNFYPHNSVFQFCKVVDFRDVKKKFLFFGQAEVISATNPNDWFVMLRKEGCRKIRLYYRAAGKTNFGPEYMLAGFVGGGGTWLIETIFDGYSHFWRKQWSVSDQNAPDRRLWSVHYARIMVKQKTENLQLDLHSLRETLSETLTAIENLAYQENFQDWAERFKHANATLSKLKPEDEYYHRDLLVVKNYSLGARQLIFAAANAWVFGGMGWWNDNYFKDQQSYEGLTDRLYETINKSIVAVANTY